MPCRLLAEEIDLASSTLEIPAECSKIAESKEECLVKGGDCTDLMKSFKECVQIKEKQNWYCNLIIVMHFNKNYYVVTNAGA